MAARLIAPGELVTKDPADIRNYPIDWDARNLSVSAQIATSTWTITAISPSTSDAALTKDSESKLTAAEATALLTAQGMPRTITGDNRFTQVRLTGGTLNQVYEIANKIVTNETPAQTKELSFRVLVQN